MESVLAIKVRTGELNPGGQELVRRRFRADITQSRVIVGPPIDERHYQSAPRLLARYGTGMALRILDALQLSVAMELLLAGRISVMIAGDHRLCKVAEACGCATINPADPGLVSP